MGVSKISISPHFAELAGLAGQALDQWSHVELELASLFQYLTKMPDAMIAQVAVASIKSFDARVQVVNNIIGLVGLPQLHRDYWKWLYNRLTKLAKKRNEIAHFTIVEWGEDDDMLRKGSEKTIWRLVPYFSLGRMVMEHSEGLSAKQIRERGQLFNTLYRDVAWLRFEVQMRRGKPKSRPKANPIPVPDRVLELRAEASRTPKGKRRPPQS